MSDAKVCGICGDAADATPLVDCIECENVFHLNPRADRPGKDCGDAILGESLGVEMICNDCLGRRSAGVAGGDLRSMYAALTGGQFLPPAAKPASPSDPAAPPSPSTDDAARSRRRFRRIDR